VLQLQHAIHVNQAGIINLNFWSENENTFHVQFRMQAHSSAIFEKQSLELRELSDILHIVVINIAVVC
jgi:hypothetical protein